MMPRCAICSHYTFKKAPKEDVGARLGHCDLGRIYMHPNPTRDRSDCRNYERVPDADLPARIAFEAGWLAQPRTDGRA